MRLALDPLFSDGMMLQREKEIRIWGRIEEDNIQTGKTEKDEDISVPEKTRETDRVMICFDGSTTMASVQDGRWTACLPSHAADTGLSMTVCYGSEEITVNDIDVGDIWVAGGQSNMEFYLRFEQHVWQGSYPTENEHIRFYDVPKIAYPGQEKAFDYSSAGIWRKAVSCEEMDYFSAAGFYFAEKIYASEQVPIGIIGCNWGGTAILGWMNSDSVKRVGKPWWDETVRQLSGMDLETYYRMQDHIATNDTGNLMKTAYAEYLLPVVRTDEEAISFIDRLMEGQTDHNPVLVGGLPVDGSKPSLQPQQLPGAMYTHMVKKICDFPVKGVLFYQGESDEGTLFGPELYDRMFSAMIHDWRDLWQDEALPFLAVMLAPFRRWMASDCRDFVTIRKQQRKVAMQEKNVYLASIGDSGMEMDIHPKDKKTVGERLALLALGHIYGKEILCEAPSAVTITRAGNKVRVTFSNAGSGLYEDISKPLPLEAFDESGTRITWQHVVSQNLLEIILPEEMTGKVRLAFAWSNWHFVNLFNSAGIPAFPFESDYL